MNATLSVDTSQDPSADLISTSSQNGITVRYFVSQGNIQASEFVNGLTDITDMYDFPGYVLTMADGTRYFYSKTESAESTKFADPRLVNFGDGDTEPIALLAPLYPDADPHLTKIIDAYGNTITIDSTGINSKTPSGSDGPSITFEYEIPDDPTSRVIGLKDAGGNEVVKYSYGPNGDLVAVSRRTNPLTETTPKWSTTTYNYVPGGAAPTHLIQSIKSDSGKTPIINEYNDDGTLKSTTDAFGHTIQYTHNQAVTGHPNWHQEVVVDRRGGSTVYVHDQNGDVLSVTDPAGDTTTYQYETDGDGNSTHRVSVEIDNETAGAHQQTEKDFTYDAASGMVTQEVDKFWTLVNGVWVQQQTTTNSHYSGVTTASGQTVNVLDRTQSPTGAYTVNSYYDNTNNGGNGSLNGKLRATLIYDHSYNASLDETGNLGALISKTTYDAYDARGQATVLTQWAKLDANGNPVPYTNNATGTQWSAYAITVNTYDPNTGWLTETDVYNHDYTPGSLTGLLQKTTYTVDADTGNVKDTYRWKKDSNGNWSALPATHTDYDAQNRAIQTTNPLGSYTKTDFNGDGQVSQTISDSGDATIHQETTNHYDPLGQLSSTTDAYGKDTTGFYDIGGAVVKTLYPDNTVTKSVYDSAGRVVWSVDRYLPGTTDQGASAAFTKYDPLTGRVLYTARFASVVVNVTPSGDGHTYDSAAVTPTAAPLSISQNLYDGLGRVIESDLLTGTIDFTNDTTQRTIQNPVLVQKSTSEYNAAGELTSSTQWARNTSGTWVPYAITTYAYDDLGRQVLVVDPDHDATNTTSPKNHETELTFDTLGRQITATGYADDGHAITTQTGYDELGEKISATDALGNVTQYVYGDGLGNVTSVILPAVHDALDTAHPTSTTSPTYSYEYDAEGHETKQTDPMGRITTFTYDHEGNQLSRTLPPADQNTAAITENDAYDILGRHLTHTDFNGQITEYVYDDNTTLVPLAEQTGLGRLVYERLFASATQYDNGAGTPTEMVHHQYDALGRQNSLSDSSGTWLTTYDDQGRLWKDSFVPAGGNLSQPDYTLTYSYDAVTNRHTGTTLTRFTYGSTPTSTVTEDTGYAYDDLGRLKTVISNTLDGTTFGTAEPTSYDYDLAGNLKTVTTPGGVKTSYFYDGMNRLTEVTTDRTAGGTTTHVSEFDYTLLDNGLRDHVIEKVWNAAGSSFSTTRITWGYDDDRRLTSEVRDEGDDAIQNGNDYTATYGFDLAGNRRTYTVNKVGTAGDDSVTYAVNGRDEVTGETSTLSGQTDYQYDDNGSLKTKTVSGTVAQSYTWDLRNRMHTATVGTATTTYVYDPSGYRISETTGTGGSAQTRTYVADRNNPTGNVQAAEERLNGAVDRAYVLGLRVEAQKDSTGVIYLLRDGHGSTRQLASDTGGVITDGSNMPLLAAYDAYGSDIGTNPITARTTQGFGGDGVLDRFTGLTYHDARWRQGYRFISMDGSGYGSNSDPVSLHEYNYTGGDPVNLWDPSGHMSEDEMLVVSGLQALLFTFAVKSIKEGIEASYRASVAKSWQERLALNNQAALNAWGGVSVFAPGGPATPRSPGFVMAGPNAGAAAVTGLSAIMEWPLALLSELVGGSSGNDAPSDRAPKVSAGSYPPEPGSNGLYPQSWRDAINALKTASGRANNFRVPTLLEAKELLNQALPDVYAHEYPTYKSGGPIGWEIHPPEPDVGNNLWHIKWYNYSMGKSGGAEGHIFFETQLLNRTEVP